MNIFAKEKIGTMNTLKNNYTDFLNDSFTSKEFNFINNIDLDTKEFEKMLKSQELNKELIIHYINHSTNLQYNKKNQDSISNILDEAQNILNLIDENIKSIKTNIEYTNNINTIIVDLLIEIKSNTSNSQYSNFSIEKADLKNKINEFCYIINNSKSNIQNNNAKINEFFKKANIKNSFKKEPNQMVTFFNKNNKVLIVSEKEKSVFLPYSEKEVLEYLEQYPNQYRSFDDVIKKEFILPIDSYTKHSVMARFREGYSLIRDRESKSIIDAFKFAINIMFRYDLHPAIIAGCKTQNQLENYLDCLNRKKPDDFKDFEIKFEVNPI
jgi:hypothetical protein